MNQLSLFVIIIAAVIASLLVKRQEQSLGLIISIAAGAIIIADCFKEFSSIAVKLDSFTEHSELFKIHLKALGITIISQICIALCDEVGDKLLSFTASFSSKLAIVIISLPLIEEILTILNSAI